MRWRRNHFFWGSQSSSRVLVSWPTDFRWFFRAGFMPHVLPVLVHANYPSDLMSSNETFDICVEKGVATANNYNGVIFGNH